MSIKKVCVLLGHSLNKDSRAQRTIRTMSKVAQVDVFYVEHQGDVPVSPEMFNENVNLLPVIRKQSFLDVVWRHSFFFFEYQYLIKEALKSGEQYDTIYAHDLPTTYASDRLAKRLHANIIYDIHDLYIETINQFFPLKASAVKLVIFSVIMYFMKTVGRLWEKSFLKRVALVLTVNSSYVSYLQSNYQINSIITVANYPEYREVPKTKKLYEELHISETKNLILYHGMLNAGRNLELITGSAEYLNEQNVLVVIGDGPLKPKLELIVSERKIGHKVKFHDRIKYEELFFYVSSATIGLMLIEHINLSKKYALANKVTEYMASGVPVVASESPENIKIISEAQCGYTKSFESELELGQFLNQITYDKEMLAIMGQSARRAFEEKFNWSQQEQLFLDSFQAVLAQTYDHHC